MIDDWRLFHERVPGIGAAGAVDVQSHHDVTRLEFGSREADHDGKLGYLRFPIAVVFFRIFLDRSQHFSVGDFRLPLAEGQLITQHQFKRCALQRTVNRLAGDLLPPSAGLSIAHEEVLVVDPRQIKMQDSAVYGSRPHQTGVTERSIGDGHRDVRDDVVQYVVVGHFTDWISAGVGTVADGKNHLSLVELARGSGFELRSVHRMEHPLEIVETGHDCGETDQHHHEGEKNLAPWASRTPHDEHEYETDEGGGGGGPGSPLAEGHRHRQRRRSLVVEWPDDEGWNEKKADGHEGRYNEEEQKKAVTRGQGWWKLTVPSLVNNGRKKESPGGEGGIAAFGRVIAV